jgi:hypothetical protein
MEPATLLQGNATASFLEQVLREAGLDTDETIWVRVRPRHIEILGSRETLTPAELTPANFSSEERARRLSIVRRLYGIWSEEQETAFQALRCEIESRWQTRDLE